MTHKSIAIAAGLLALCLGACSRSSDEPAAAPIDNGAGEAAAVPDAPPVAAPPPAAPTPAADGNLAAAEPPAPIEDPDEQMLDDASATGMTARASRGEVPANDAGSADAPKE